MSIFRGEFERNVDFIVIVMASLEGTAAATAANYGSIFTADRDYELVEVTEIHETLGTDGNDFYQIDFRQPVADTSTDAWDIDISNVQLEFGDTATDFEYVSPADQLARCQRYFQRIDALTGVDLWTGQCTSTTKALLGILYIEKRDIPSVVFSEDTSGWRLRGATGSVLAVTALLSLNKSKIGADAEPVVASGLVAGNATVLAASGGNRSIDIDAEL